MADQYVVPEQTLSIDDFKLWSTNALEVYVRVRNKKNNGSFDELGAIDKRFWASLADFDR